MNIYEMLDFIRKHDASSGHRYTAIADFLNAQHLAGRIASEDVFYMFQDIMETIVRTASYKPYS